MSKILKLGLPMTFSMHIDILGTFELSNLLQNCSFQARSYVHPSKNLSPLAQYSCCVFENGSNRCQRFLYWDFQWHSVCIFIYIGYFWTQQFITKLVISGKILCSPSNNLRPWAQYSCSVCENGSKRSQRFLNWDFQWHSVCVLMYWVLFNTAIH